MAQHLNVETLIMLLQRQNPMAKVWLESEMSIDPCTNVYRVEDGSIKLSSCEH